MEQRPWISRAKKGLFTHEDSFPYMHKIFGFPCLAHFLYRTGRIWWHPPSQAYEGDCLRKVRSDCGGRCMQSRGTLFKRPLWCAKGLQASAAP